MYFKERSEAGGKLADLLEKEDCKPDVILATSEQGFPVAKRLGERFSRPVDILLSENIEAPGSSIKIGAVASDGTLWLEDRIVENLGVGDRYIKGKRVRKTLQLQNKTMKYRGGRKSLDIKDRSVLLVDDGVSIGFRMKACLGSSTKSGAGEVVVASPVMSQHAAQELSIIADRAITLTSPRHINSITDFYRHSDTDYSSQLSEHMRSGGIEEPH